MKRIVLLGFIVLLSSCHKDKTGGDGKGLNTDEGKFSYALGIDIAHGLESEQRFDTVLNTELLIKGMREYFKDSTKTKMSIDSARNFLTYFMLPENVKLQAKENLKASDAFVLESKARGMKQTPSGLLYQELKPGNGAKPTINDVVKVNYVGKLSNGEIFDTTEAEGRGPVEFPLTNVIKGWAEGLQMMPQGSTYKFVIPPSLAYGLNAPPQIGPEQALEFEVELLEIMPAGSQAPVQPAAPGE